MAIKCFFAAPADKNRKGRTAHTVAELLGSAHGTINKILKEHRERSEEAFAAGKDPSTVRPPPDEPEKRVRVPRIKDRHVDFVLRCLSKQMFEEELEELPSLQSMYEYALDERVAVAAQRHCTEEDVFPFARTSFYSILQTRLGYVYRAGDDDREQLKLQAHIVEQRRVFLRKIEALRVKGYILWYLDETWINKNTTRRKSWELGKGAAGKAAAAAGAPDVLRPKGKKKPTGKGGRAIVIGIGSRQTGVVGELLEIFKGKKSKTADDYHKEMNAKVFEEWLEKVLDWILAKYPNQKHAIVMDNASYHSRLTDDCATPKMNTLKADIIAYMIAHKIVPPQMLDGYNTPEEAQALLVECIKKNVPFTYKEPAYKDGDPLPTHAEYKKLTKAVLLQCIPAKEKKHVPDKMAKAKGVQIVRLPPYHCEFNPIELVWARAKAGVAKRNVQYNLKEAMEIMRVETEACDAAYWTKLEQHAMKEEKIALGGDEIVLSAAELAATEPILITIDDSSSSSESEE